MRVVFFLLFFHVNICISQVLPDSLMSYHTLFNEGIWDINQNFFQSGIAKIEDAFTKAMPKPYDIKRYIRSLEKNNLSDTLIIKWVSFGIRNYGMRMIDLFDEASIDKYQKMIDENTLSKYFLLEHLDSDRDRFFVEHYFLNDTYFRSGYLKSASSELQLLSLDLATFYDTNVVYPFIVDIIQRYNFPTAKDIGYSTIEIFYFLLRHHRIDDSVYTRAFLSGKLHPRDYASLMDYNNLKRGVQDKMYGPELTKVNGEFILLDMIDMDEVDKRRIAIGLLPLFKDAELSKPRYKIGNKYIDNVRNRKK